MTCAIGLLSKDRVLIGADSAEASDNGELDLRRDAKAFKRGDFVFAFAGSWRYGQLVQYSPNIPIPARLNQFEDNIHMWMVRVFVPWLGDITKGLKDEERGDLLVGFVHKGAPHLYVIYGHNFQVAEPLGQFSAIGTGSQVAKGSISAGLRYMRHSTQEQVIKDALEDASRYVTTVRGPFTVLST